ncbi:hypothetical protein G6O67_007355 [Ophiocordyceps sinensis]|uniref:ATP-dependent RNA helicase Mrh4 n=1 Tax=Ophiocordyceps sinensis TaxID=72228 RepID=A0A8H4LTM7_9HYPO|nr:hypothetical protein G6O67_007355 [Ophiocordyceps sinensis]
MPRPKRTRRAPPGDAKAPEPPSDSDLLSDDASRPRGRKRTRTWRPAAASRLSLGDQDAIRAANRTRDAALDRLANEDATTASGHVTDDTRSSIETGRRAMATPAMRRDTTGLDLADDDVFGDLDDSFADGDVPGGRRSMDSSSLTMSHFKPRSRQSSIVGRNDPPIRPSSRGPTTPGLGASFNIGLFRRRAREPSILGTSRKPRPEAEATTNDSDMGSEASFEPEAESTPLSDRRATRRSSQVEREPSPAQSNSRKRKSVEASDESDQLDKTSRAEPDTEQAEIDSDSELSVLASPPSHPLCLLPRPVTPANQDEITAPPASSDSEGGDNAWPDIHVLARRRRRLSAISPLRADNFSDVSSPPSLTHSPNYAAEKATRRRGPTTRRQQSPKITTADLTNLLPKRRHKRIRTSLGLESDEELDTTDLAQDEDELSYLDTRAARRRKRSRPHSRAASARPASRARADGSVLKPKQTPAAQRQSARSSKTDPRRSSDKENESEGDEEEESAFIPLPDNTFDEMGTAASKTPSNVSADELKQAAKKFMEVDKWELEFEEVVEPPSSQNAR